MSEIILMITLLCQLIQDTVSNKSVTHLCKCAADVVNHEYGLHKRSHKELASVSIFLDINELNFYFQFLPMFWRPSCNQWTSSSGDHAPQSRRSWEQEPSTSWLRHQFRPGLQPAGSAGTSNWDSPGSSSLHVCFLVRLAEPRVLSALMQGLLKRWPPSWSAVRTPREGIHQMPRSTMPWDVSVGLSWSMYHFLAICHLMESSFFHLQNKDKIATCSGCCKD